MTGSKPAFWNQYQRQGIETSARRYRAIEAHRADGTRVIVYEIDHASDLPETLLNRIRFEARRLAQETEPNLLRPLTVSVTDEMTRIICPRPVQNTLAGFEAGLSSITLETVHRILDIAERLLVILESLHEAGILIRCLLPRDIDVDYQGNDISVCLAGCPPLALLHGWETDQASQEMLIYAAPETLGALDYDVQAPSDLYSFGIVLYELVCGRAPFVADNVSDMLFHHVTSPVPEPGQYCPCIPAPLRDILLRLLKKHPRDRYQSAAGVLYDIRKLRRLLVAAPANEATGSFPLGTHDQRNCLIEPAYVGRDKELEILTSLAASTSANRSHCVLMTASSGIGKTGLLQHFTSAAVGEGFRILKGQGINQPGLSPLTTLEPAMQACIQALQENPGLRRRLSESLRSYSEELNLAAADVAAELQFTTSESADREFSDRRIAVAVATLLQEFARQSQPLLLLIDDAQWADDLTLAILDSWQLTEPTNALLVVATRPNDELLARLRSNLNPDVEMSLHPLQRSDSDLLLQSMAGTLPAKVEDTVWGLAAGNPFVTSAVLRGLVEGEAIRPTDSGWEIDEENFNDLQMSGESAEILKLRLIRLPLDSQRLLAIGAVLGKQFDIETAALLANISYESALEQLAAARLLHLIWERATDGLCRFSHDQIRDAVLATVDADELARIHRLAGEHLLATSPDRNFEIACHFDAAGCPDRAFAPAFQAAQTAQRRHAIGIAEQQYRIALKCCPDQSSTDYFRILDGLGTILMLGGRYEKAEPILEQALEKAQSVIAQAEVSLKLGELYFKRDDKDKAVARWESALETLGGRLPSGWTAPFATLREITVQAVHTLLPKRYANSSLPQMPQRDRLLCRLYSRLSYGYWYLKGKIPLLYVHLRGMNLAERFAPSAEVAQAWSEHAPAMSLIPLPQRGIEYGRRSLQFRTEIEDIWGQGQSLHFLAIALYAAGRFEECIDVGRRSVRILDRAGDFWEKHIAQYQVAASLYRVGKLSEAVQLSREAYDSGLAVGDDQLCGNIIEVWSRATNGDLPADLVEIELKRPRADVQGTAHVLLARGVQLLAEDRLEEAVAVIDDGIVQSRAAGIVNCYTSPLYAWKATALRAVLEEHSPLTRSRRQNTIRKHRRAAWRAFALALRFRSELPHALRELGWAYVFQNKIRRATLSLKASIRQAEKQGAHYERLQSLEMLHRMQTELGVTRAEERLLRSEEELATFRSSQLPKSVTTSVSLVERFDSLLDSGRTIASTTEHQDILATTISASQRLLRSDVCRIVAVDANGQPESVSEGLRPFVSEALKKNAAMAAEDPSREFRSLLLCPIVVRGVTTCILVVGNTEVRNLFGENELRIITFITTICGASLENAEGLMKLRGLNENLEFIVEERTAAVEARSRELQKTAEDLLATQDQLAEARDAAEVANQAKSDFLAHMSHEIRTPIGAVLGFTELLINSSDPLTRQQQKHLRRVQNNGSHLLQLLNDLLDLSKIEAGQLSVEILPCRIVDLMTEIIAAMESRAIDKGLTLGFTAMTELPPVIHTDPTRLRQIVTNLLSNSIKFTGEGGVDLCLELLPDQQQLNVHVRDTGVGIPDSALDSIFSPFQQADETINRNYGGTGLGLPISRRLAQALGGDLTAASKEGNGSTFTARITTGELVSSEFTTLQELEQLAVNPDEFSSSGIDLSGYAILIADDVSANREFIRHTLEAAGATVECAVDGQDALNQYRTRKVDLVLMDMRMPVLDGYSAVTILRREGAVLPIIALTANGLAEDELRCREVGCSGYLTKPISMQDLLTGVAENLFLSAGDLEDRHEKEPTNSSMESLQETADPGPSVDCPRGQVEIIIPDDPFFQELSIDLIAKVTEAMPVLREAIDQRDMVAIQDQAHWMKGTGGTVGLPSITELGARLEHSARAGDFVALRETVDELQHNLLSIVKAIRMATSV